MKSYGIFLEKEVVREFDIPIGEAVFTLTGN